MRIRKESFHPYAAATIVLWSLAYVLTRIALQYFTALSLGFLRYFTASCALLLYVFITKTNLPKPSDIKWFLASGGAGFFLYMIFFNKGCETVNASTSSMILATVPIITALLARLTLGEMLNRFQLAATLTEFAGVAIITLMRGFGMVNTGIFRLLLAAAALSVYNLLQRRLTGVYSAMQVAAFSIFSGTLMLSIFSFGALKEVLAAPAPMIVCVLILGVFSSAAAYAAWAQAFAKANSSASVSNYMFLTPLLASLLGFLLVGEKPDLQTITGGIVILTGMAVFYFGESVSRCFVKKNNDETCRKM